MARRDLSSTNEALADTLSPAPRAGTGRFASEPRPARRLARGERVGRYVIEGELAEGGMGVLYRAYDPELARRVVIKLIRGGGSAERNEVARARLLREGQALAQLSHPNVVSVHDVGHVGDDTFVAMEHVPGVDLTRWRDARPRTPAEVIAVFVAAGHGLAAAHRAGLVHRDVKPGNIVAADDGRVKVVDFGLAALERDDEADAGVSSVRLHAGIGEVELRTPLTQVGAWIGTPCYMAPEQYDGEPASSRSDQFAFCVAMYEALHGELPFAGDTFPEYAARVAQGELRPPRSCSVPAHVDAALRRGLAVDPAARWSSMDELVAALAADPAARRRRALALAAIAGAVVALGGVGVWALVARDRGAAGSVTACADVPRQLAAQWGRPQAEALRAAFLATGSPYAASAAERSIARLDAWGRGWVAARVDVCTATASGAQPAALLEARARCLAGRLDAIGALARALTATDRDGVPRAVEVTSTLPPPGACADAAALQVAAPVPADPATRTRVEAIRGALTRASALEAAGKLRAARDLAETAVRDSEAIAFLPLRAEAMAARGHLEIFAGELDAARVTLERAAELAADTGQDALVAEVLIGMVRALSEAGRGAEAIGVATAARTAVSRSPDRASEGRLLMNLGSARMVTGDLAGAEVALRDALQVLEAAVGPGHLEVATAYNRLGGVLEQLGRSDEARAAYARAGHITEQGLGPDHPWSAVARANLCWLDGAAGRLREARACQADVVRVLEAAFGDPHPKLAWALNDAAMTDAALGDRAAARAGFTRALAMWEATVGPEHPDVALALINLGELDLVEQAPARAVPRCRRAVAIVEKTGGTDHPQLIEALGCLGSALIATTPAEAVEVLERAHALWQAAPTDPLELAKVELELGRALLAAGAPARAIATVRAALARASSAAPASDLGQLAAQCRAWLRDHARGR